MQSTLKVEINKLLQIINCICSLTFNNPFIVTVLAVKKGLQDDVLDSYFMLRFLSIIFMKMIFKSNFKV